MQGHYASIAQAPAVVHVGFSLLMIRNALDQRQLKEWFTWPTLMTILFVIVRLRVIVRTFQQVQSKLDFTLANVEATQSLMATVDGTLFLE